MTGIEPVTSSLPRKRSTSELHRLMRVGSVKDPLVYWLLRPIRTAKIAPSVKMRFRLYFRAGDRVRTGDIQLGRLTLYQLSYSRIFSCQAGLVSVCRNFSAAKLVNFWEKSGRKIVTRKTLRHHLIVSPLGLLG